jgi:hypothetical protein
MTRDEQMKLLLEKCAELGQSEVAKQIDKSPSTVNQLLHGSYRADPGAILQLVEETFGTSTVMCPEMGEIPLKKCAEERQTPFSAASPRRIRMHRACKACEKAKNGYLRNQERGI